jgi:hypothetical protein
MEIVMGYASNRRGRPLGLPSPLDSGPMGLEGGNEMTRIVSLGLVLVGLLLSQVSVAHAQSKFLVREGVGIGDVTVGQTLRDAIAAWGQPDEHDSDDEDDSGAILYTWYMHPGEVNVIIDSDGRIGMLFADRNRQFYTQSGLIVSQSTMSDVRLRLGPPEKTKVHNDTGDITWFYWHRGIHITFNGGGVIKYIAVFEPV